MGATSPSLKPRSPMSPHQRKSRGGQSERAVQQPHASAPSHAVGQPFRAAHSRPAHGDPVEAPGQAYDATPKDVARRTKSKRAAKASLSPSIRVPRAPKSSEAKSNEQPAVHLPRSPKSKPRGQKVFDPHRTYATRRTTPKRAGAITEQPPHAEVPPLADVLPVIYENHKLRCQYQKAALRLGNQIWALTHREKAEGPAPAWMTVAAMDLEKTRESLKALMAGPEKEMTREAKNLPVFAWAKGTHGVGILGVAQVIAECGDLANYANPGKIWKRMGLAVSSDGQRQRKRAGEAGLGEEYSPRRRAIMWNIGGSFIRQKKGPYYALYVERKEYEAAKPNCGRCPEGDHCRPAHIHNRARRYAEKRFLRDLWREWRRAKWSVSPTLSLPAVAPAQDAA